MSPIIAREVVRGPDWNPLGPSSSEPFALGLMAARAAAAVRHANSRRHLDEIDVDAISSISAILRSTAEALAFVESGGSSGELRGVASHR